MYIAGQTANDVWEMCYSVLCKQYQGGFKQPSRGGNVVGEELNAVIVIENAKKGVVTSPLRNMDMNYAVGELMWYMSGSRQLKDISQYSKFWNKISDDGKTLNSAYGYRIHEKYGFDQWEYVKMLLHNDPLTRQAVIHIKDPSNRETKDMPCTCVLQYILRENQLHATTYMRSNDIWLGLPYDLFAFTSLQVKMAFELGVEVGTYTHIAGSLHLYERNTQDGNTQD